MATKEHVITFNPNPMQQSFIESRALADLFASRVGEGKSTALAWTAFQQAHANPGSEFVMIRDTWENMQRTTLRTFLNWFPDGVFGTWTVSNKTFKWADRISPGSQVVFTGMENESDASKLLSWELSGFGMDEPAPAVGSMGIPESAFDIAMTRLRKPGMKWYPVKLATNNPDESHWTWKKFAGPEKVPGYKLWQPGAPENVQNLPEGYYETMRLVLKDRPDLIRRFIDGKFGFQIEGKAVTPQWSDDLHLTMGLVPVPRTDLHLCWDFGHNPSCIITQVSPLGYWLILEAHVGDNIGVEELILGVIKPTLARNYAKHRLHHIGDPAGTSGEQTSIYRSAVRSVRKELGGDWKSGPVKISERVLPLQSVLGRTIGGRGVVQVDRFKAPAIWHALRGGWHYNVARTGVIAVDPKKNIHSHPGDALAYGAAVLFPMGKIDLSMEAMMRAGASNNTGTYFGSGEPERFQIGEQRPGTELPKHGEKFSWEQ